MALPPKFAGQLYLLSVPKSPIATPVVRHTLEIYLDYVCPFSARMFNTIYKQLIPKLETDARFAGHLQFIFRQQIQPWHPSSTLVHEAAVAVLRIDGNKFWKFSEVPYSIPFLKTLFSKTALYALFNESKSFYDVPVISETRNQTYARLAAIAEKVDVSKSEVLNLLTVSDKPAEDGSLNIGNGVTNDLKVLIKMARLVGIHVSPTVLFDGVVESSISSSWTVDQWVEWLETKL
ncbi:hypothetical protein EV44_g2451 [Erysiphe necator]|uniref:Thioredoxin-like fold domain-containing protein n=1 Tax=Uncinula necator TaxID=52586 RepID=A0A0B1P7C9_UNCNE|nr:hypothetical protein EV44_g2451 [Erysiphe necator]